MKKLFLLIFLAGCAALPLEEEVPLPMFAPPADVFWNTIPVQRGNVVADAVLLPVFNSEERHLLSFAREGFEVEGIFVSNGDFVTQGQLIASLKDPEQQEEIAGLRRSLDRLALQIRQLGERHEFSLRSAELSGVPLDDSFYLDERERLENAMYFLRLEYEAIMLDEDEMHIFSPIDGVVSNAASVFDGQMFGTVVAIIEDMEQAFFRAQRHAFAAYITPGDRFTMTIVPLALVVEVEAVIPYGLEPHPTTAWFSIVGGEDLMFDSGTLGRIVHVFEEVTDVIAVPSRAVRRDGERHYVYTVEEGIRRIREVEIGLWSPQFTQIISGLTLGELIIL
ncbi:MAG: efflux RND transporter periplasmic adaptor subunit [Defluviitaleaceae bacterium]|nr:efflux RND transporter periplasmic adaptor subunit [Defluviitaleaceae bacterium]